MPNDHMPQSECSSPDPEVAAAIGARARNGKLTCAAAHKIAAIAGVSPLTVGRTVDALGIRLTRCQLGLFGFPDKQGWKAARINTHPVPEGLIEAISAARDEKGNLTCERAWKLAAEFRVPRLQVGYLADQLGIHFIACQLGAF